MQSEGGRECMMKSFQDAEEHSLFKNETEPASIGEEDDFEFDDPITDQLVGSYLERINKDFDQRKTYEEIVLRILNFYQRTPQKHPTDASQFRARYKKSKTDLRKRTLFLDLDDLLISVSLFQHPNRVGTAIDIKDNAGKTIKVSWH